MKTTIENLFDLNFDAFSTFLKIMNGYIAGSFALYDYMMNSELQNWQPNDIDIWIPLPEVTKEIVEFEREFRVDMYEKGEIPSYMSSVTTRIQIVKDFLKYQKCVEIPNPHVRDYKVIQYMNPNIYKIYNFMFKKKKIQVIFTANCEPMDILNTFDISGCRVVWCPSKGYNLTPAYVMEDLKQKRMFVENKCYTDRTQDRIHKYKQRGFKLYTEIV